MQRLILLLSVAPFIGCETQFEGKLDRQTPFASRAIDSGPAEQSQPSPPGLEITFPEPNSIVRRVGTIIGTSNLPAGTRVVPVIVPAGDNRKYRQMEARVDESGRWLAPGCVFGPAQEGEYSFTVYATAPLANKKTVCSEFIRVTRSK